jgi:hypothetical protein
MIGAEVRALSIRSFAHVPPSMRQFATPESHPATRSVVPVFEVSNASSLFPTPSPCRRDDQGKQHHWVPAASPRGWRKLRPVDMKATE